MIVTGGTESDCVSFDGLVISRRDFFFAVSDFVVDKCLLAAFSSARCPISSQKSWNGTLSFYLCMDQPLSAASISTGVELPYL